MVEQILTVRNVNKNFGHYRALTNVNLSIARGDSYGLIGKNGAGKTTLMRLITGLSPLTHGEIMLLGESARHYKHALSRIGAIIENPVAFAKLTVWQNLKVTAIQHGLSDDHEIDDAIAFVGLGAKSRVKAKHLSLGQRQRLGLATAILAHPDFLILDEPINGLDPSGIIEFRQLLHRLNTEKRTTILISSHILTELYQVANRFGFLNNGTIVKELTKSQLDVENQNGLLMNVDDVNHVAQLLDQQHIKQFTVLNDHQVVVNEGQIAPDQLNQLLVSNHVAVNTISKKEGSLEDYFMRLINERGE